MEKSKSQSQQTHDPLRSLKFKGYCWSQTPPGEETTLNDLVSYAKFFLCKRVNKLWKDPIWEEYSDEEILIEYFAHLFVEDAEAKREFEMDIDSNAAKYEEAYEWLDRMVKQNQEENRKMLEEMPEKISFVPGAEDREE